MAYSCMTKPRKVISKDLRLKSELLCKIWWYDLELGNRLRVYNHYTYNQTIVDQQIFHFSIARNLITTSLALVITQNPLENTKEITNPRKMKGSCINVMIKLKYHWVSSSHTQSYIPDLTFSNSNQQLPLSVAHPHHSNTYFSLS